MLKILVFIECDLCNGVLQQIAVAKDPRDDESDLDDVLPQLHGLRLSAEEHGWQALKDSTVHYCKGCCRL